MRYAHTLFMVIAAAIAAMAMTATTATAQSVEVEQEANPDLHCAAIESVGAHDATGGCELHAVGQWVLTQHTIVPMHETPFTACNWEFTVLVNEDGFGYIDDQVITGAQCGLTPCDEAETEAEPHDELLWPMIFFEGETESGDSSEGLATTLCIRALTGPEGIGLFCTLTVDMYTNSTGHPVEFEAEDIDNPELEGESCFENPAVEINGHWTVTDSEAVVHHTL